jgi:hypothetical protein
MMDKGNKIEMNDYNSEGCLDSKVTFKYDDNGNLIEENNCNFNGSLNSNCTYRYKYDNNDNWIEQIKYESEANIATEITERTIEYYE